MKNTYIQPLIHVHAMDMDASVMDGFSESPTDDVEEMSGGSFGAKELIDSNFDFVDFMNNPAPEDSIEIIDAILFRLTI